MARDLKSLIIIFKVYGHLVKHVKLSLEDTELSVNEFSAMEALYTKGTLTTQGLIDLVLIPNSSMTYVLDTLAKKGYLIREKDLKDRRVHQLSLTEQGRAVFKEIYDKHFLHMRDVFDVLTEEEELEVQDLLKKLGKYAERIGTDETRTWSWHK